MAAPTVTFAFNESAATPADGSVSFLMPAGVVAGTRLIFVGVTLHSATWTARPAFSTPFPTVSGLNFDFTTHGVLGAAGVAGMDQVVQVSEIVAGSALSNPLPASISQAKRWIALTIAVHGSLAAGAYDVAVRAVTRNDNTSTTIDLPALTSTVADVLELFVTAANPQYGNPPGTVAFPGTITPQGQADVQSNLIVGLGSRTQAVAGAFDPAAFTYTFNPTPPATVPLRSLWAFGIAIKPAAAGAATVHSDGAWLLGSESAVVVSSSAVIVEGSASITSGSNTVASAGTVFTPPATVVISDGATFVSGASSFSASAIVIRHAIPVPPALELTDWIYERLPQSYRDEDEKIEQDTGLRPLRGYISLVGDPMSEISVTFDRLKGYTSGVSELADPDLADSSWLGWLAAVFGVRLDPNATTDDQRDAIAAWDSVPVGSRAAVEAAARGHLTGTQLVFAQDHAEGSPWKVALHSRESETPDAAAMVAAAQLLAPAGVEVSWDSGVATWADIETLYPKWADIDGLTWQTIEETKA